MADHAGERRSSIPSEGRDIVARSATAPSSASGRSVIITIGIDRYRHWRALHNAVGDALGAAALFERLGFSHVVPPLLDDRATGAAIEALVTDELTGLGGEDSLVIFYAGHGGMRPQRVGERDVRTGYLIPVDAADDPQRVQSWIELDPWLRRISRLPPRHILVILDACFSGIALSSAVKWGRDSGALPALPFAAANLRPSRLVIASALDDERAMDSGPTPGHSLFTGCLIEALTGGLTASGIRDGRHVTIGSALGHYIRHRVQTYPGRPGWRQTPDLGSFDVDERGEMLIPLLVGSELASLPPPLARGSAGRIAPAPDAAAIAGSPSLPLDIAIAAASSLLPAMDSMGAAPLPDDVAAVNEQQGAAALDVARLVTLPLATADTLDGGVAPGRPGLPPAMVETSDSGTLQGLAALPAQASWSRRLRRWHVAVGVSLIALAGALASVVMRDTGTTPQRNGDRRGSISTVATRTEEGGVANAPVEPGAPVHDPDTAPRSIISPGEADAPVRNPNTPPGPNTSDTDRTGASDATDQGAVPTDHGDGSKAAPRPPMTAPPAGRIGRTSAQSAPPMPPPAADGRSRGSSASAAREPSPPPSTDAPATAAATDSVVGADRGAAPSASKSRRRTASAAPSSAAAVATTPGAVCMTTIDAGKDAEVVWKGQTLPATTPLPLPCGEEVSVEIRAPGHVPEIKKVVVDGSPRIKKRLRKAEFQIYVDSKPQRAQVWVGARSFGFTPTWVPLPVGRSSTLKLKKQGYEDMIYKLAQADDGLRIELPLRSITPPAAVSP